MKVIRRRFFSSLLLLPCCLAALLATGAEVAAKGPGLEVGKKAPKIELKDQNGDVVKVAELLEKGPVAVVFHRSANW